MKHRIITSGATLAALLSVAVSANADIIITAPRIDTPVDQMSTSSSILTADEIESSGQTTLSDLLQTLPGISVSRSGGPGQATQIYLRGAKPQHTQIMIDGVRMNGQLDLSGYNMAHLQLIDIERVEILKGPHSPLYGSDAIAGVINIVSKKGAGDPTPYCDLEGGSYGTWRAGAGIGGGDGRVNYAASVSHFDRQGESAMKNNSEKDGSESTTVATRIGCNPTEDAELTLTLRYIDASADYDDGFGTAHADFMYDTEQLITRAETTTLLANDLIETTAGISYLMIDREEFGYPSLYNADTYAADWANTFFLHDNHTLLLGIDGYYDSFRFDEGFGATDDHLHNLAAFGSYQACLAEPWILNLGVRHDEHSEFHGETTHQSSSAYTINATGTKIKGAYGTGFKAPTSYQLFASFGNPDLEPEESRGWEAGIEQQILTNRLSVGSTWFRTDYEQLIDFDFVSSTYQNISEAKTTGVETYLLANLLDNLRLRVGYTYLDNDDESNGTFSFRRPTHQIDADLAYAITQKLDLNLYVGGVDERKDVGGATMDAYVLVNLAARYRITENLEIHGRIENLLDEDYETVAGYNTDALSAYAGIRMKL